MKKLLIVGAIIALVAWGILALSRSNTVKTISGLGSKVEMVMTVWGEIKEYVIYNAHEIESLKDDNKVIVRLLEKSNEQVLHLQNNVKNLELSAIQSKAEIDSLKSLLKTEPPKDFDDCLNQLNVAGEVIKFQDVKIQTLKAVNTQQGLIISEKDVIISLKDEQVEVYRQLVKNYKIRMAVVSALNALVWVIVVL